MSLLEAQPRPEDRVPRWVAVGSVFLIAQSLFLTIVQGPSGAIALQLAIALVIALLLVRGSRLGWTLALIGAVVQAISGLGESWQWWAVGASALLVMLLCARSSMAYVWGGGASRPRASASRGIVGRTQERAYLAVAKAAQFETGLSSLSQGSRVSNFGPILRYLGSASVGLFLVGGAVRVWQDGSAGDSLVVEVLSDLIWSLFFLALLASIACIALLLYGRIGRWIQARRPS